MISVILHLALALMNATAAAAVYWIWTKEDHRQKLMGYLFIFYTAFAGYHLSLSLPFYIFGGNLTTMAWGYNLAIAFVFLLLVPMYTMMIFQVLGFTAKGIKRFIAVFFLTGATVVLIQVLDFRLPVIIEPGFILWSNNFVAGLLTFLAGASVAVVWTVIFLKNRPVSLSVAEKAKIYLFTLSGLMFSIASVYFIARNLTMVIIAFIFVFIGTALIIPTTLMAEKKTNHPI